MNTPHALVLSFLLVAAGACDDGNETAAGTGTLAVTVFGEAFIEDKIPAEDTVDGWEITFSTFLIAVGDVEIEAHGGTPIIDSTQYVLDLSQPSGGEGHLLKTHSVPADGHYHLGFRVAPATANATLVNATSDGLDAMVAGGYAIWVEGTAVRGTETKTFAWGFSTDTRYGDCHSMATLAAGGEASTMLTIHADHVFFDSLVSDEPGVAFDIMAGADADADGVITQAELAAVDITSEAKYQVGNRTDITDLWSYLEAQTGLLGHIDGEGHCDDVQ